MDVYTGCKHNWNCKDVWHFHGEGANLYGMPTTYMCLHILSHSVQTNLTDEETEAERY